MFGVGADAAENRPGNMAHARIARSDRNRNSPPPTFGPTRYQAGRNGIGIGLFTTNEVRAAFYPRITVNGTGSWTNNAGAVIANPGKLLLSAVGSLVQPIFNRGLNRAKLRVAKAQQQEALLEFQQSLLNAGEEVSNACYRYTQSERKLAERREQLVALHGSVAATQELMRNGDATYLEVLTAQQSLLAAQLSESEDEFEQVAALVSLYRALGGGREIEAQP